MITCKLCKTEFSEQPDTCHHCGFPFNGTREEQGKFIGQQLLKSDAVEDTGSHITKARIILFVIGGFDLLILAMSWMLIPGYIKIIGLAIVAIFIGGGILARRYPIPSILIPLLVLLSYHTLMGIIDTRLLAQGMLWKVISLFVLSFALFSTIRAEKLKRESEFLRGKDKHNPKENKDILDQF
jgi:hypothetical protein